MAGELKKFCDFYKQPLQANYFSCRFQRNNFKQNRKQQALYICFMCLTKSIYCVEWIFDSSFDYRGKYDPANTRFENFQIRVSLQSMREHVTRTHKKLIKFDDKNIGTNFDGFFVEITDFISFSEWDVDQLMKSQQKNNTKRHNDSQNDFLNRLSYKPLNSHEVIDNKIIAAKDLEMELELLEALADIITIPNEQAEHHHTTSAKKKNRSGLGSQWWSTDKGNSITEPRAPLKKKREQVYYDNSSDDEVSWQSPRRKLYAQTPSPLVRRSNEDSLLRANDYVTDSGRIETKTIGRINSCLFEPHYFAESFVSISSDDILTNDSVNLPKPLQRMAMNEHYCKLDYDYIATPIDDSVPLKRYDQQPSFIDFRDEEIILSSPPTLNSTTLTLSPHTTSNVGLFRPVAKKKNVSSKSLSELDFNNLKHSVEHLIKTNSALRNYRIFCIDNTEGLKSTMEADYEVLTKQMSLSTDKRAYARLDADKSLLKTVVTSVRQMEEYIRTTKITV